MFRRGEADAHPHQQFLCDAGYAVAWVVDDLDGGTRLQATAYHASADEYLVLVFLPLVLRGA